jgi:hypothetical protein
MFRAQFANTLVWAMNRYSKVINIIILFKKLGSFLGNHFTLDMPTL